MTINAETARAIADHAQNERRFRELVADLVGDLHAIKCAEEAANDMLKWKIENDAKDGHTAISLYYDCDRKWSYKSFDTVLYRNTRRLNLFIGVLKERIGQYGYTVEDGYASIMIRW